MIKCEGELSDFCQGSLRRVYYLSGLAAEI